MIKKWIDQPVAVSKQWTSNYCLMTQFQSLIPFGRRQLDKCMESGETFKHDQTTTVVKLELPQGKFVLKRYNPRSFAHKFKRALRRSRADRCWQMSYRFERAGLNVARPVFMYEDRFGPICKNAYFASEFISGEELLKTLPEMTEIERQQVSDQFRQALAAMRTHLISHGDMKASNLLWENEELYFIDLDAARQHSSSKTWHRANRRDRERFMKNWRDHPELTKLFSWVI